MWKRGAKLTTLYALFVELFKRVFDHQPEGIEVGEKLLTLQQEDRRVAECVLEFCTLAAESGWNKPALKATFRQRLDPLILTKLACRDEQQTLDSLINLAIGLDNLLQSRLSLQGSAVNALATATPTPMEISNTCMTHSEHERRCREGL